ncbi:hypothetical protein SLEP1_g35928 [Rubroshorea leprosula]|uniref:GAG-pre-integrase domain-containing protein n=1 Tax=Rubroshorea leprosula TaxID=152421 RepID=A0AAV5KPU1_9ROSI|nr:hypothetical protein SLEP1_g35928 [Rubroshorea leprosula]
MSPNNSFPDIYSADGSPMNDSRTGQLLGTGHKVGCLFELNYLHILDNKMDTPSFPNDRFIQTLLCAIELESLQIPYQQIFQVCAVTNISPLHLWHSRLRHTSVGKLRPLISHGLLGSVPNEFVHCVSCQSAKQPVLSFSSSHSHSTAPFDLVHSDVWGPSPTPTMGGSRHILDFVRALLISSSCPERFWCEAALKIAYLINCIPSSVLNNQSPYERLHGILPAYNLLKRSKKQAIPYHSNIEAEYKALGDTTSELLSLRWLLEDIGIPQPSSTDLYCDNQSAMQIAHNDVFHERTKYIEVDCHFIRHHVAQGTVHLVFIGSTDQPADLFTKAHFLGRFCTLLSKLKLVSSQPP